MKTTRVLTAVSAAALLGISSFALAQGTGGSAGGGAGASGGAGATTGQGSTGGGAGSSGAPAGNTMQRQQDAPSSGSMSKDSPQKGDRAQGKDSMKSKSNQAQQERKGKDDKSQAQRERMGKDSDKSGTKSKMSKDQDAKSDTTVGAAGSGGVNLTTEQRTTIRQTVLTSSAPRVDSVNFSINVGTVVPSTVRVVEVPPTIVKIRPAWKGYRYFVHHDHIVIVQPRTMKIVAVLEV